MTDRVTSPGGIQSDAQRPIRKLLAAVAGFAGLSFTLLLGIPLPGAAQPCETIPYSEERVGLQNCGGVPGDTVWVPLYTVNDSAIVSFVIRLRYDSTVLRPLAVSPGDDRIRVEPAGRWAGSDFLTSYISEVPSDSGALIIFFLPVHVGEDEIPPGKGVILRIPFLVLPEAWYVETAVFRFPRYTVCSYDSSTTPPDSTCFCSGTGFLVRSEPTGNFRDGYPRTSMSWFATDPYAGEGPRLDWFGIEPRSVWQGEEVSFDWQVSYADSIVIRPDVGMDPSSYERLPFVIAADSPMVYTLTAYGGGPPVSRWARLLAVPAGANRYPYWRPLPYDTGGIAEGRTEILYLLALDPDGTMPEISVSPLPDSATLTVTPPGDVRFQWKPAIGDTGYHTFVFRAADADDPSLVDSLRYTVYVRDLNQSPTWTFDTLAVSVYEGDTLLLPVNAFDLDGVAPRIAFSLYGEDSLAANMVSTDNGDGSGVLRFAPDYFQGNAHPTLYPVVCTIRDGADSTLAATTPRKIIRVYNRNSGTQTPAISLSAGSGPMTVTELDSLVFEVRATTTVGDLPDLTAHPLPSGATFTRAAGSPLNDRMVFRYLPPIGAAGVYGITFSAVNGALSDSVAVVINVEKVNSAPFIIVFPGDNTIDEEDTARVVIRAVDPDSTVPILTAFLDGTDSLAPNMVMVDSGNGAGVLTFVPNRVQGNPCEPVYYYLRFRAADPLPPYPATLSSVRAIIVYDSGLPCCVKARGDVNYDGNGYGAPNIADLTALVRFFIGVAGAIPCFPEADLDASGTFNVADITFMVNYLFIGTFNLPVCPVLSAGQQPPCGP